MPVIVKKIDEIGREKMMPVLSISFNPPATDDDCWGTDFDWQHDEMRMQVLAFLTANNIPWVMCGEAVSDDCTAPYMGRVFTDVPFDENNEQYQLLKNFLENDDGSMRYDNVTFWVLPLSNAIAMANSDDEAEYCKDI